MNKKTADRFEDEKFNGKGLKERLYTQGILFFESDNRLDKVPTYNNAPVQKHKFFKQKIEWQNMPDRFIVSNIPDMELPDNSICTTKYTALTFLPKNLMEQFSKLANVYFLVKSTSAS
jgi:hypothetical protein